VKRIVKSGLEQEELDHSAAVQIAEWADAHEGKLLTERNKPEGWMIRRQYGMTELETDAYARSRWTNSEQPGPRATVLLAHQETNVRIPSSAYLAECSPAFFTAAVERNDARRALLEDPARLRAIARALNRTRDALALIAELLPTGSGPDSVPDRYDIIRAAGLGDVKVGRLKL